jgi:hypothetical protein
MKRRYDLRSNRSTVDCDHPGEIFHLSIEEIASPY